MTLVELEWGLSGARQLASRCDLLVLIDVLSFTTSVTICVARGATVWPYALDAEGAQSLARDLGAQLASGRSASGSYTLSPASLLSLPPQARLILPSPNGSAIAHAVNAGTPLVAGCLRNVAAVVERASEVARVGLVPAGERWGDGSLRPAYEDWLCAGAVAAGLGAHRDPGSSPLAQAAAWAAEHPRPLEECSSGRERIDRGFAEDVHLAQERDVDPVVPTLTAGRFTA